MTRPRLRYDVLLLLCAVIGTLLVFARYRLMQEPRGSDTSAAVSFRVTNVSETVAGTLLTADSLTLTGANASTFRLTDSPTKKPALVEHTRSDGTLSVMESATLFDVHAVFLCDGSLLQGGFFVGARHMAAAEHCEAQICGLTVTIEILNIDIFSSN